MHEFRRRRAAPMPGLGAALLVGVAWLAATVPAAGQQPVDAEVAAFAARPLSAATPADLAEGRKAYMAQCALCHGVDGSGGYGPTLLVATLTRAADDAGLQRVLAQGIAGAMPGYGQANGVKRTWQLAAYVRTLGRRRP